jgi:pyruvate/2-oxoglutarate dehydrogenase complex dihydrolipoamide dehydrogenase (E3) component
LKKLGQKQLIIGNGFAAYELADFLSEKGDAVTVVLVPEQAANDDLKNMPKFRAFISQRLLNRGVTILAEAKCEAITAKGATIVTADGKRQSIEVDSVLTTGTKLSHGLVDSLKGQVPVIQVGDCGGPRGMMFAFEDGFRAGLEL